MNDEEIGVDVELDEEEVAIDAQSDVLKGDKGEKGDPGIQGEPGEQGEQGEPGYTPVKGVDYFTNEDIEEIEEDVEAGVITAITPTLNAKANADDVYTKSEVDTAMGTKQNVISSSNKITSDLVDDTNQTNKFVTASDKTTWGAKYDKPSGGIPKTDLDSSVQTSLDKADTALQRGDITDYVKDTDYATSSKGGVIKVNDYYKAISVTNTGALQAETKTHAQYNTMDNSAFIGKGTLENVITGKQLVNETQLNTKADKSSLVTGSGTEITLQNTAELEFIQPPLPRGNSEQVQLTGSNKFNKNTTIVGSYNCTYTFNDGVYTITSINTQNNFSFTLKLDLSTGSYTLNSTKTISDSTMLYNSQNEMLVNLSNNHNYYNFSIAENSTSIRFNFAATSQPVTLDLNSLQIVSGTYTSSTMPAYEPYVGGTASPNPSYPQAISNVTGDVEVLVQNKNLFDKNTQVNNKGLTWSDGDLYNSDRRMVSDYININDISSVYSNYYFYIFFYDKNKNYLGNSSNLRKSTGEAYTNIAIPSNENIKYFRLVFAPTINNDKDMTTVEDVMVTKTQAGLTTYTPHKEQTYTFPLGNQRMYLGDYLADDGIHHVRKQVVFDGSEDEDWVYYENISNNTRSVFYIAENLIENYSSGSSIPNILSSRFKAVPQNVTWKPGDVARATNAYKNVYFIIEPNVNLDGFKTWLSNNNVIVEFILETEEITPYTTEQQQAYDEIKQAISYDAQTNISGTSDEANPLFSVQAVQYKEPDYWTIAYVNGQIGNAIGGAY